MVEERAERPSVVLVSRCMIIGNQGDVLLIQRSESDSWNPNLWELPGGKVDKGEDLFVALQRELLEETGLLVNIPIPLAVVMSEMASLGKYKGLAYVVQTFVGRTVFGRPTEVRLSNEHQSYQWREMNESLNLDLTDEARKALKILSSPPYRKFFLI